MRTSNKILLGFALLMLVTATSLALNLRYRIDHHLYTRKITGDEVSHDVAKPLGHITRIHVNGFAGITVNRTLEDSIWFPPHGTGFNYRVIGDTLELIGNPQDITIGMSHLNEVELKGSGNCDVTGFNGESLAVYATDGFSMHLDTLDEGSLSIRGHGEISLSNSKCGLLLLDSTTNFHAEQDLIGSLKK
jgi:hypothetical protein